MEGKPRFLTLQEIPYEDNHLWTYERIYYKCKMGLMFTQMVATHYPLPLQIKEYHLLWVIPPDKTPVITWVYLK